MNETKSSEGKCCSAPCVMKRYELKYRINAEQTEYLKQALTGHMEVDEYGLTPIVSLYYDTPDMRLIRTSLEKPVYKEKIRLRSYGKATEDSSVYLELKRKYDGVVYKRRVATTIPDASRFFAGEAPVCPGTQIGREITCFRDRYGELSPSCLIIYDRTAYYEPDGDLRLTIDSNPRCRFSDLSLTGPLEGRPLLNRGESILEIKVQRAMPLWLTSILSEGKIYKSGFSKYGEAYRQNYAV